MNRNFRALFRDRNDLWHIAQIQLGIDALRKHIHSHGDQVAVTGALSITKQRPFDTVSASH